MSVLQLVFSQGEPCALPIRVCGLRAGSEMDVLPTDSHLPEAHPGEPGTDNETERMASETQTVIGVVLTHKDPLPEELLQVIEARVYDWLNARGVLAIPEAKVWYSLDVKDM